MGRYDAAEILASGARGTLQGGDRVGVPLELTPVRTDVRVRADRITQVTFDLVVQDLRDHGKTWGVLLEEVRVEQVSAGRDDSSASIRAIRRGSVHGSRAGERRSAVRHEHVVQDDHLAPAHRV